MQEISDIVLEAGELQKYIDSLPEVRKFDYGFGTLDKYVDSIAEGDFIVFGGRPGTGKTTFAVQLTKKLSDQGIRSLWFSIELPAHEFLKKFPQPLPLFYVPGEIKMPTMTWLEKKIDEAIEKFNVKFVFIDHLLMITDEGVARNRNALEIYDERLKTIKAWAVQKKIAILGISPLVQDSMRKKKTEPDISDIRGSAMVGYYADLVIMMERGSGRKANELNELDDLEVDNGCKLWIVKCRRTGVLRSYVAMQLNMLTGEFEEQ